MRVLLDTNVLLSAILFGGVPEALLRRALGGEMALITSVTLLDELEDLLVDKFTFSRSAARLTRAEVESLSDLAVSERVPQVSRDRDDDHVLAAAVAGRADMIVTGDKDLLVLQTHAGIPILTPRQLLDRLE